MNLPKVKAGILYKYENDPLAGFTADNFKSTLIENLKGRAEEVWIFGSFARNGLGRDSDIDLLIVTDTDHPFIERPREFEDLYDLGPVLVIDLVLEFLVIDFDGGLKGIVFEVSEIPQSDLVRDLWFYYFRA